ncbi:FkbM family methyltransferase [Methylomonas sp. MK1]|uniref:FkbM family methyltransferase n=1 Tax=Methylomonas sp. MK1 TaxID=1131552 RepID=UPI000364D448|nr:FkbM family methyltransferase [Methylomonas sp. MK1]
MTFMSYSQNFEDVMLWRVLNHVENGIYIDVGAAHPIIDSVTKAFYEKGWRGINIEPIEYWFEQIVSDRPRDINLNIACAAEEGELTLYEVANTGMSTINPEYASRHEASSHKVIKIIVPARRLDNVIDEFGFKEISFLKIDVEGAEALVLQGIDLNRIRPWIILIEATEPNTVVTTHEEWESLIVNRGYDFVYFDGLNRFYLAKEQHALQKRFHAPPNCFDNFTRYAELKRIQQLESDLHAIHTSMVWRILKPFLFIKQKLKKLNP